MSRLEVHPAHEIVASKLTPGLAKAHEFLYKENMSDSSRSALEEQYKNDFLEALKTLKHSWDKLKDQKLPKLETKNLDDLESWEALTVRFARSTNIFLSKYIRLLILKLDPGFRGEMRDYLDKAEKAALITDADTWMKIRELRNKISHEYSTEDLEATLKDVLRYTPFVLEELGRLET